MLGEIFSFAVKSPVQFYRILTKMKKDSIAERDRRDEALTKSAETMETESPDAVKARVARNIKIMIASGDASLPK